MESKDRWSEEKIDQNANDVSPIFLLQSSSKIIFGVPLFSKIYHRNQKRSTQ